MGPTLVVALENYFSPVPDFCVPHAANIPSARCITIYNTETVFSLLVSCKDFGKISGSLYWCSYCLFTFIFTFRLS